MSGRRIASLGATAAVGLLLGLMVGVSTREPEPPRIVLRSGGQEQRGPLNHNEWCPFIVPMRCTGFVKEASAYPSDPLRVGSGSELVFEVETRSVTTRFDVPDDGQDPTGGDEDFAPARRAEVVAPIEPGEYEVAIVAEFLRGHVYRGFYLAVEPAKQRLWIDHETTMHKISGKRRGVRLVDDGDIARNPEDEWCEQGLSPGRRPDRDRCERG